MTRTFRPPLSREDLELTLDDGETVVAQGRASIPPPPSASQVPPITPAFLIGRLIERWVEGGAEAEQIADDTSNTGFPLTQHMVMVLTTERILTWSRQGHPGDPRTVLASVPLARVSSVTATIPRLGSGKDVRITLKDGLNVLVRVDSTFANALISRIK